MISTIVLHRGNLRRVLLCAALVASWSLHAEHAPKDEPNDPASQDAAATAHATIEAGKDAAEGKPGKDTNKKHQGAVLTVIVIGKGNAVSQAEVKVKLPASVGGEVTMPTNDKGEAVINSTATGVVKLRVIANGWESLLQDVALKEGTQRVTVNLVPLS